MSHPAHHIRPNARALSLGASALVALGLLIPGCNDDRLRDEIDERLGDLGGSAAPMPPDRGRSVPVTPFQDEVSARAKEETRVLLRTRASYEEYFGHAPPAAVALPQEWVIFYAAGEKPTGGYVAKISSVRLTPDGKTLEVVTSLESPGPGCAVTLALTNPYALAKIPAQPGAQVVFRRSDTVRDCGEPPVDAACAAVTCPTGSRCVILKSSPPQAICEPAPSEENPCNLIDCKPGTTCIVLKSSPPQAQCVEAAPEPTNPCAAVLCQEGTVCRAKQVQCVRAPCPPVAECVPIGPAPDEDPCAAVRCRAGTHCEAKQVECVRAPCPPVAECVPDAPKVACGGLTGAACPGAGQCTDDPSDSCDPTRGADCGGLCACTALGKCIAGNVWDASPSVCGCVPAKR